MRISFLILSLIPLLLAGCETLTTKNTTQTTHKNTQAISTPIKTAPTQPTTPIIQPQAPSQTTPPSQSAKKPPIAQSQLQSHPQPSKAYSSVWEELSDHFQLTTRYQGQYDGYVDYFRKKKAYLNRVSKRAKPYLYHILQEVKKRKMPYEVALLPAVESGFSPKAKSYQSAAGLWQFIPGTAHLYDLHKNWWYDGRMDIIHSTDAALNYLQKLYTLNHQDWLLALASYNAGVGNVYKAQKKFKKRHPNQKADFWAIRKYLPKETQNYVPQLLAISYLIQHRQAEQLTLEEIPNTPYLEPVPLKQQVSLKQVCQSTGVSEQELKTLNPCYLRPTTPPYGQHHLVLPKDKAEKFKQQLAENKDLFKINWAKHKVKSGESLSVIAHKYHTSVREIKRINHMRSSRIRAGKTLLIPYPKQYASRIPKMMKQKYNGKRYFHKVKKGESIWTIANYYNISTQTLCRWNNIGIRTPLRVGQRLEIHSGRYGHKITHKLRKGESLWTLAKRYGTTSTQLAKWNHIKRNKVLQPGETLVIWMPKHHPKRKTAKETPSDNNTTLYKVKPGDSLWKIAKRYQTSTQKLIQENNLSRNHYLNPGQTLKVPVSSDS